MAGASCRRGQLHTNRTRVESKQEALHEFKTVCACARAPNRAGAQLKLGLPRAVTWGIHRPSASVTGCCLPHAANEEDPDVKTMRKAEECLQINHHWSLSLRGWTSLWETTPKQTSRALFFCLKIVISFSRRLEWKLGKLVLPAGLNQIPDVLQFTPLGNLSVTLEERYLL